MPPFAVLISFYRMAGSGRAQPQIIWRCQKGPVNWLRLGPLRWGPGGFL